MGRMGNFNISGLEKFRDELNKLQNPDDFVESCAKELAARLLRMVVKRTPVGDYSHEIEVVAKRDSKNHKKGDVYKKKVKDEYIGMIDEKNASLEAEVTSTQLALCEVYELLG